MRTYQCLSLIRVRGGMRGGESGLVVFVTGRVVLSNGGYWGGVCCLESKGPGLNHVICLLAGPINPCINQRSNFTVRGTSRIKEHAQKMGELVEKGTMSRHLPCGPGVCVKHMEEDKSTITRIPTEVSESILTTITSTYVTYLPVPQRYAIIKLITPLLYNL